MRPGRDAAPREFRLEDGARLAYLEFGDPAGPVAVVTPGLSDGLAPLFHPPARKAVEPPPRTFRRFRVLLASHRDPLPEEPSTADLADDLAGFVDAVAGSAAVVVGHSMGGMVAQHLAAKHPDVVDRIALSSTLGSADHVFAGRLRRWERLLADRRWRDFHRDAIDASFTGAGRWRRRARLRLTRTERPPDALVERHLRLSHACREHDASGELSSIRCPTLVVSGRRDVLTRPERARELADAVPDARFVALDDAGHGLPEQRPRAYARALESFLEG